MPRELTRIIRRFRILRNWQIKYDPKNLYKAQVEINPKTKTAIIFDWGERP